MKLMQEKLALRDLMERHEDEEKREKGTDPDSDIGSTSDYSQVLLDILCIGVSIPCV